jgi:hypothetical protein
MCIDVYFKNEIPLKGKRLDAIIPSIKYFSQPALLNDIHKSYVCMFLCMYTGCPRRNVSDFGRVFLMLKYTDVIQNTYVQS